MAVTSIEKRAELAKKRLEYSRHIYESHGIVGNQAADDTMRFLMGMYAGDQWHRIDGWAGIDDDDRVTVNKIFSMANQLESEFASRPPTFALLPRGKGDASERAKQAGIVSSLLAYDIDELEFEEQSIDAAIDNFFAPFGAVRHLFTPREEHSDESGKRMNRFRHERPDKPFIRRYAPWDCFLDPTAARFTPDGGCRYVIFRDHYTLAQIESNPGLTFRKDLRTLQPGFRGRRDERPEAIETRRHRVEDPESNTIVEVFTHFDAVDRTWLQFVEGVEKPIREEGDWPIPWEWLPVSAFVANRKRNSPFGVPVLEPIANLQEELNKIRTMISWLARAIRRLIGVDASRMDPSEVAKLENAALTEILKVKGPLSEIVQNLQAGTLPQELLLYAARIIEDMREVLGLSLPGVGQRINVESAQEAFNVQSGQDVNIGRILRAYEKFWKHILQTYFQARRATMELTGEEVIRLLGTDANGALAFATVSPEMLHADYEFLIVPNSTRRRDPMMEERLAMARYQMAAQAPDIFNVAFYAMRLVAAQQEDPQEALMRFSRTSAAAAGLGGLAGNVRRGQTGEESGGGGGNEVAALLQFSGAR